MRYLTLLLLCLSSPALADEPVPIPAVDPTAPAIRFPVIPSVDPLVVQPVNPVPVTDPDAVPVIRYGQIYAVESTADFFLDAYPSGVVDIVPTAPGPITVRGVFAGGNGKIETRTIKSGYVAFVDADEVKTGRVTLVATPVGVTDKSLITRQLIDIGVAPQPPPKPDDPPKPPPAPTGLKAMVIEITSRYAALPLTDKPKLATAFRDAATKIESGAVKDIPGVMKVTSDLAIEQLGIDAFLPWTPWKTALAKALDLQGIKTPQEHVAPWRLIADVLEGK